VEAAVRELLAGIGEDPDREGLRHTPERVARAYAEAFSGLGADPANVLTSVFDEGHEEMVIVKNIELASFCEHHLLPFYGVGHVGYIPRRGQITGLSKLARLIDVFADALVASLHPRGVIVVIECEHLCMSMRGVRKPGAQTVTSAVRGVLQSSASTRAEAMSLIHGR